MPSDKAVLDVIEDWSGGRPGKMSQNLEEWWNLTAAGSSHSTLKFDPDGIEDLVRKLRDAFPTSPALETGDFGPGGSIKTVQQLSTALLSPLAADLDAEMRIPAKKSARKAVAKKRKPAARTAEKAATKKKPARKAAKKAKGK
ncbi:MAG: hypothetical protein ABSC23_07115 [Bryobacteraceae bacterium]|jgi:hypothetical protein